MNDAEEPGSLPGRFVMPNSNGWSFIWSLASVMLKLPVPIMPTLPEPNWRWNVSPFSEWSLSWTLPALTMSRAHWRTSSTPGPTSGSSPHLPASMVVSPVAHISGPTVKMLQPAQLPGR